MDGAARLPLEAWYFDVPVVTRAFITASVLTSIAVVPFIRSSDWLTISNVMLSRSINFSTAGERHS
jgi:hypothetical protein